MPTPELLETGKLIQIWILSTQENNKVASSLIVLAHSDWLILYICLTRKSLCPETDCKVKRLQM